MVRPRHWFLPLAAVLITGLCLYRATRPPQPFVAAIQPAARALPPRGWELPDHEYQLVKFDRYLGRQPVVLLFVDASQPLEQEPRLVWLRDHADALYDAGWRILAITTAKPAEVRSAAERAQREWPFPVLTDMHLRDPAPTPVHHLWSRVDRATGQLQPAVFLVDRMGYIEYQHGRPRPEPDGLLSLESLTGTST